MSSQGYPNLSKSRFTAGLQCLKRLYLEYHRRELADRYRRASRPYSTPVPRWVNWPASDSRAVR